MNRVRIVALAAASLGVAVMAGTFLQGPAETPTVPQSAAMPAAPVETSLAGLAATAPEVTPTPAPQVTGASILPGALEIGAAGRERVDQALPRVVAGPANGEPLWLAPPATATDPASDLAQAPRPALDPDPVPDAVEASLDAPDPCAVWLAVLPQPGAAIEVSLFAPCDGGAVVGMSHRGLRFDVRLDVDGQLLVTLPALAVLATVEVSLADGRRLSESAVVADVALHDRVAIQWQGPAILGLNAYEFGASYGEPGHVGPVRPETPGQTGRGYLSVLGDPEIEAARLAQVYSFPSGLAQEAGLVELELEVAITAESCGQPLEIEALEMRAGASPAPRRIRLDMPACDGTGGYLLLRNLLPDLSVALN